MHVIIVLVLSIIVSALANSRVVPLPAGATRLVVVLGSLAETTVLLALGGETARLAVLVDGIGDPVDTGITTDGLVLGAVGLGDSSCLFRCLLHSLDKDDLVVLVNTVLVDPVRVKPVSLVTITEADRQSYLAIPQCRHSSLDDPSPIPTSNRYR